MVGKIIETEELESYYEATTQPGWVEAMNKEIQALMNNVLGKSLNFLVVKRPLGVGGYIKQNTKLMGF